MPAVEIGRRIWNEYAFPAHPWPGLVRRFSSCPHAGMRTLVLEIAASRYAALHALGSHYDLIVGVHPEVPMYQDALRVSADRDGVRFEYWEQGYVRSRWTRTVPAAEAFAQFERIVRRLHWMVDLPADDAAHP